MDTLHSKRIVVIGGSGGFGLATAKAAGALGAHVVIASSNQARIDKALAQLPTGSEGHVLDASSEASQKAFFERVGAFDHLVYTAGEPLQLGPLADTSAETAQKFFGVRFWGAYNAARFAAKSLRAGGSITFTSGTAGPRPLKGWTVAAAICSAMEGMTRALAVELAPIRVNCVRPGAVDTDLWSGLGEDAKQALFTSLGHVTPVGRVGRADELGEAYLFLLRGGFMTGSVLTIDGGGVLV
jgi:NAD(P)-dependent dehydrogenase (short-subunit alcohol dehydrogenase family)